MKRGKFIVLEGADGSGTTSQMRELCVRLGDVLPTAEPSKGPVGEFIRRVLRHELPAPPQKAMELLFRADRIDHVEREIEPALASGQHVVCDRYYPSTLVYQSVRESPEESLRAMWSLFDEMFRGDGFRIRKPDVILYLSGTPWIMESRRRERGQVEELYESTPYQQMVVSLYDAWARNDWVNECQKVWIDGDQDIDTVSEHCWRAVREIV